MTNFLIDFNPFLYHFTCLKVQLAEVQRNNADERREVYSPSDFQCEIAKLSFQDFINRTNVEDIVEREFRRENNDMDVCLSDNDKHSRLEFFYNFRIQTDQWHVNGLKNLKFTECECKRNSNASQITNDAGVDGLLPETENVVTARDIGVQCSLMKFQSSDKSTNTDHVDLQPASRVESVKGDETNPEHPDETASKSKVLFINDCSFSKVIL